eukprot:gene11809-15803_t
MIKDQDVENEGFKPLKKKATEPVVLAPSKMGVNRGMSLEFNADTGEKESSQALWENSAWEKFGRSRGRTMDRANSFIGSSTALEEVDPDLLVSSRDGLPLAVAIVDPFSTGIHLAAEVCRKGLKCIRILSVWDSPVANLVQQGVNVDFVATIQHNDTAGELGLEQTIKGLRELPFHLFAIIAGAETGVELSDQLASALRLRSNGTRLSLHRRNKWLMGETVRSAGVRAVKQASVTSIEQVLSFISDLTSNGQVLKCVLKPVQSAGTDDVFLCVTIEEAIAAFERIYHKINGLGQINESVLIQEYLQGKEYVIDKVSRDGEHKLVAIWEYDKRSINGANFVYFGMRLKSSDGPKFKIMIEYADKILDALDIKHGPSHMEVMLNTIVAADGTESYHPCLVEVGARCHGGEGTWLPVAKECVGYTQVELCLDSYLSGKLFKSLTKDVLVLKKAGREVDMVSRYGGIVRSLPGDATIRQFPSFRSINWEVKPGDYVSTTIDCFTRPGCVQLVADKEEDAERDLEAIHDLEKIGLIDYAIICPKPPSIGAVVIVDPFSSGANLAAMILQWGYKLILVFSEKDSPVAKLVAKGTAVNPTLMVQHDNGHPNQKFAISQTLAAIESSNAPILAILPGAETGVELADHLAARYGTRNNGEDKTEARRNKYLMQELIRSAGIRAIQQQLCRSEQEVTNFFNNSLLTPPAPLKKRCVVKPNESAGTDSVYLCDSLEDAIKAFHAIHNNTNGLGQINDGALCQEFLAGTEFVIDGVSRDGVYKVTAIWQYDKRSVNGANFVYFGMSLRNGGEGADKEVRSLIEYSKTVVKALGIMNGPSHMEVMSMPSIDKDTGLVQHTPCLVEVGSRCHGGEASWLPVAMECIGYSQLDATLNCYLRPDRFDSLPSEPKLIHHGCEAFLVSYSEGILQDMQAGMNIIRNLQSFRRMEMMTQPGVMLKPTIDCFTRPGSIQMVNESEEALLKDYKIIRDLEITGLFEIVK